MMEKLFATIQEAIRKDIERALGVLQEKWNILCSPSKFISVDTMEYIMKCSLILRNMFIK